MRVTVLGCGNSTGVPVIGCNCSVCLSENIKNQRLRVSALVEEGGKTILIDSSPDLRQQALKHQIKQVDAILYTHAHADHANGIDDLRMFNYLSGKPLPAYANRRTIDELTNRFSYVFSTKNTPGYNGPSLIPHIVPDASIHYFDISGITICSFEQLHGKIKTLGYRIGNFAYSTDVNELPDTAFEALKGVAIWIVDCLRYEKSFSHSYIEQTLAWIDRVKPRLAILTHMDHDLDYEELSRQLPSGVIAGYDGMVLEL